MIREHVSSKPEAPLDKPEQFLHELAEIPNFADRIACFMFQSEFEDGISSIENKLNNLKSTCQVTTPSTVILSACETQSFNTVSEGHLCFCTFQKH
jgi:hypothetical protein